MSQVGTIHPGLATIHITWLDTNGGSPVPVDGDTVWSSSNAAIVAVTVSPGNPLIANLNAPGPLGTATITATADGKIGAGVVPTSATIDITVVAP